LIEGRLVNPSSDQTPPDPRASIRIDARLDETTRQKVDDLAQRFHQPRSAVLCHIIHWGLNHGQTGPLDQVESPGPVHHLSLYVASDLHEQVQKAATAAGVKGALWLRHMVRQITATDFPASWQAATPRERSHDSRTHTERFMLRLDEPSQTKLQQLIKQFGASKAAIIRHLIAQTEPEDFPKSWHIRAAERHVPRVP
jgi:predicted transcriptional regulator